MIRNRLIWLFLFVLSLVGISFYGGAVSYGFFFLMLFIPIISLIYLLVVYLTFKIYQRVDRADIPAGETVPYYFSLQNEGFTGFASIRVLFFSSFSKVLSIDDKKEYELYPSSGIRKDTFLICKYRGEYEVGIKQVEIADLFRLFLFSFKNRETVKLDVKPAIADLSELKGIDVDMVSFRDSAVNATIPDLPVRDYVAGDDYRKIHWKATARGGALKVRTDTGEEKQGISLVVNPFRTSDDEFDYIPRESRVLEAAVAVTLFFAKRNIPEDLYLGGTKPVSLNNLEGFDGAYEAVSAISFDEDFSEETFYDDLFYRSNIARSKYVFIFTGEMSAGLSVFMERLKRENVAAVCYVADGKVSDTDSEAEISIIHLPTDVRLSEVM